MPAQWEQAFFIVIIYLLVVVVTIMISSYTTPEKLITSLVPFVDWWAEQDFNSAPLAEDRDTQTVSYVLPSHVHSLREGK